MMNARSKHGFTMIELIIAIMVTSIIALAFYAIAKISADAWIFLSTRRLLLQEGRGALDEMLREIRHMDVVYYDVSPENPGQWDPDYPGEVLLPFVLQLNGLFIGESQHIQFYKGFYNSFLGWPKSLLASANIVDFYYDASKGEIIKYLPQGIFDDKTGTYVLAGEKFAIAKNVTAFRISYGDYGLPYQAETVSWADTHTSYPPDMVRVQFTLKRGNQSATFASATAPRRKIMALWTEMPAGQW